MTRLHLIGICFCAVALFGCATPVAVVKLKEPKTESACAASGGAWRHDFFKNFFCEMRTTDAGKPCTGSEQCQWACLGPDNAMEGTKSAGVCSATSAQFGNVVYVEDGKVVRLNIE
jgi:hypothetical protein